MRQEAVLIYDNNIRTVFEAAVLEIAHSQHQERNKVTNRKQKAAWLRQKTGSCYDDDDYRHG